MANGAYILGCQGPRLTPDERAFFRDADPWGFILFARNVETPGQLRRLTGDLRDSVGRDAPILIDQEGGRVARLTAPHWSAWLPPLEHVGEGGPMSLEPRYRQIATELRGVGIDANCVPCVDIARPDTHPFLANRCYGHDAETVIAAARAAIAGLAAGGVLPVMKHMPGHGRATADTHHDLPTVTADLANLEATDFAPFRALSDLPMGMTAHIIFTAIDPSAPATQSKPVIDYMRDEIGFGGLLMTDDISMQALSGTVAERGTKALAAGADLVLHCNGDMAEMQTIAALGDMTEAAKARAAHALAYRPTDAQIAEHDAGADETLIGASPDA